MGDANDAKSWTTNVQFAFVDGLGATGWSKVAPVLVSAYRTPQKISGREEARGGNIGTDDLTLKWSGQERKKIEGLDTHLQPVTNTFQQPVEGFTAPQGSRVTPAKQRRGELGRVVLPKAFPPCSSLLASRSAKQRRLAAEPGGELRAFPASRAFRAVERCLRTTS
ncbi:hypothetical protein B0H19DRAFT_1244412 [Mycena capillaripes]|nr:hypothetical protein B0H19DRAFT_1244412 [Mycena capillaripes]